MATTNTINLANFLLNALNGAKVTFQKQDGTLLTDFIFTTINPANFTITNDTSYYYAKNNINISTNSATSDLATVSNPVTNIVIVDASGNVLISQPVTPFTILSGDVITFYTNNLLLFRLNIVG